MTRGRWLTNGRQEVRAEPDKAKRLLACRAGWRYGRLRRQAPLLHGCPGCADADGPTEHSDSCKGWPKAWSKSFDTVKSGRERMTQ